MQAPKTKPSNDNPADQKEKTEDDKQTTTESTNKKKVKSWKRKVREEQGNHSSNTHIHVNKNISVAQGAGFVHSRDESNGEEDEMEPVAKKSIQQTTTLAEGNREEGPQPTTQITSNESDFVEGSVKDSGRATQGIDGGRAATGPGATGKLSGATESARHEP